MPGSLQFSETAGGIRGHVKPSGPENCDWNSETCTYGYDIAGGSGGPGGGGGGLSSETTIIGGLATPDPVWTDTVDYAGGSGGPGGGSGGNCTFLDVDLINGTTNPLEATVVRVSSIN